MPFVPTLRVQAARGGPHKNCAVMIVQCVMAEESICPLFEVNTLLVPWFGERQGFQLQHPPNRD